MLDPQHMCKLVSIWLSQGCWEPTVSLCLNTSLVESRHQESDKSAYEQGIQSLHKLADLTHRLHWLQGVGFSLQTQTQKCRCPQNHKQAYQCPAGISIWSNLPVLQEQFQNHHGSMSCLAALGRCLRWPKMCQKQQTVEIWQVNWAKISSELPVLCSHFFVSKVKRGLSFSFPRCNIAWAWYLLHQRPCRRPMPFESLVGYSKKLPHVISDTCV